MMKLPLVVVKVGGSLLDWPQLPQRLNGWLALQPPARHVFVAGGGSLCDVVRRADERFRFGQEQSHWLCVDLLSVTARMFAHLLGLRLTTSADDVSSNCVLDPRCFLSDEESRHSGVPLPHTWDVTSDSIAARIAECFGASELVLLKSADPPARSLSAAADCGYVDRHFPIAAANLSGVFCVNLRRGHELIELHRCGP